MALVQTEMYVQCVILLLVKCITMLRNTGKNMTALCADSVVLMALLSATLAFYIQSSMKSPNCSYGQNV